MSLLDESFICLAGPIAQAMLTGFFTGEGTTGELLEYIQANCGGCNDLEYFFEAEKGLSLAGYDRDLCDVVDKHLEDVNNVRRAIAKVARALYDSSRALTYREVQAICFEARE